MSEALSLKVYGEKETKPKGVVISARLNGRYARIWRDVKKETRRSTAEMIRQAVLLLGFFVMQELAGKKIKTTAINEEGEEVTIPDLAKFLRVDLGNEEAPGQKPGEVA